MKKLNMLIPYILIVLLAVSCASSEVQVQDLLQADGRTMERKLPYLDNLNHGGNGQSTIESQSYPYTVWERELRNNIIDGRAEDLGSIEIVELYRNEKPSFWKTSCYLDIGYEIRIYDNDGRAIWTRTYYRAGKYSIPLFGAKDGTKAMKKEECIMMKSVIEEFKDDVESQYDSIKVALHWKNTAV